MNESKRKRLDEILHAAYMAQWCLERDRWGPKTGPLDAIIGQMDWVAEFHRLLEGGELGQTQR